MWEWQLGWVEVFSHAYLRTVTAYNHARVLECYLGSFFTCQGCDISWGAWEIFLGGFGSDGVSVPTVHRTFGASSWAFAAGWTDSAWCHRFSRRSGSLIMQRVTCQLLSRASRSESACHLTPSGGYCGGLPTLRYVSANPPGPTSSSLLT